MSEGKTKYPQRTYRLPQHVLDNLSELAWLDRKSLNDTLIKALDKALPVMIKQARASMEIS